MKPILRSLQPRIRHRNPRCRSHTNRCAMCYSATEMKCSVHSLLVVQGIAPVKHKGWLGHLGIDGLIVIPLFACGGKEQARQ
jgi:hypothetical protein